MPQDPFLSVYLIRTGNQRRVLEKRLLLKSESIARSQRPAGTVLPHDTRLVGQEFAEVNQPRQTNSSHRNESPMHHSVWSSEKSYETIVQLVLRHQGRKFLRARPCAQSLDQAGSPGSAQPRLGCPERSRHADESGCKQ